MNRARAILDREGEPVTQERWNESQAELARLRNQVHKRFMRLPEVMSRVGLQKTQVYELMAAGQFPQAVKITERCVGWVEQEIDQFINPPAPVEPGRPGHRARKRADARRRAERLRLATPKWADRQLIAAIYERARMLTLLTGIPHSVDHEVPLQGKDVCGLHIEINLSVVTQRANLLKSNRHCSGLT